MTPTPHATLLTWCLALLAVGLWSVLFGVPVWQEPAFRRWLAIRLAQLRRCPPVHAAQPFGTARRTVFGPAANRPVRVPPRGSAAPVLAEAPAQVRIAEWSVGHLPLRYRLLGRARPAANDN